MSAVYEATRPGESSLSGADRRKDFLGRLGLEEGVAESRPEELACNGGEVRYVTVPQAGGGDQENDDLCFAVVHCAEAHPVGKDPEGADLFGFVDRGRLVEGAYADVNVIDYEGLDLHAPEYVYDFPNGAGRYIQKASGYDLTLVNGEVFMHEGEHQGALAGRVIRA